MADEVLEDDTTELDEPLDEPARPPRPDRFDQAMRVFYGGLVLVECVYLVDVLTHGAISRAVEPHYRAARGRLAAKLTDLRDERELRRQERWVVFDAIETTRDAAAAQGGTP